VREIVTVGEVLDELQESAAERFIMSCELTFKCTVKKLQRKSARFWTNSWSLELLFGYVSLRLMVNGMIVETVEITSVNIWTSFSSYVYCGPTCTPPISVKHFSVMFRNSGWGRNRVRRVSMMGVSNM
jgi:hypothetical protein